MQVVKMGFVLGMMFFLCSFGLETSELVYSVRLKYKVSQYQQFLAKFEKMKPSDDLILDVRIHQPLPVSEEELEAVNLDRQAVRKIIEKRMLLSDFDIFLPEISRKRRGELRPNTYEAEYLIKQTKHFDLVIYSEYSDARNYNKNYYIAAFSKLGVIMAKKPIGFSNQYAYTEAILTNRTLKVTSILDGQKLPLSTKKMKIESKGKIQLLEEAHPYLDAVNKELQIVEQKNYRLRVE